MTDELPCNPIMYYTTRPIVKLIGVDSMYWKGLYIPSIPFIPLIVLWLLFGVAMILIFGGVAMLLNKENDLWRLWFS